MKQAYGEFHKFSYEMTTRVRFCLSYDPLENGILLPSKRTLKKEFSSPKLNPQNFLPKNWLPRPLLFSPPPPPHPEILLPKIFPPKICSLKFPSKNFCSPY